MRHLLSGAAASAFALGFAGLAMAGDAGDLPPNATPGHCYGKLLIPELTETYADQVIDQASRTEIKVIPAVYGTTTQTVVASEAHVEYETVPATYKTITEVVVIKPAITRKVTIPAVYGEVTEEILVREAHNEWRRGARRPGDVVVPGSDKLLPTGEVICLIAIPAEYKTVTHTVVKIPEQVREVVEPAVTETITRKVVDTPSRVLEHQVPAVYKTVTITTVVQPERTEAIVIPATYRTVTKTRVVTTSHFEWRVIDCKAEIASATPHADDVTTVSHHYYATGLAHGGDAETQALQEALQKRGYYDGPLNGRFTAATQWAMTRFQRDNHLARGTFDEATANALGIPAPDVGS